MSDFPSLPKEYTIEISARILRNGELCRSGISELDSEGKPIDFQAAALAAQRTIYELIKHLWNSDQKVDDYH
jgi:hypothetical protein